MDKIDEILNKDKYEYHGQQFLLQNETLNKLDKNRYYEMKKRHDKLNEKVGKITVFVLIVIPVTWFILDKLFDL